MQEERFRCSLFWFQNSIRSLTVEPPHFGAAAAVGSQFLPELGVVVPELGVGRAQVLDSYCEDLLLPLEFAVVALQGLEIVGEIVNELFRAREALQKLPGPRERLRVLLVLLDARDSSLDDAVNLREGLDDVRRPLTRVRHAVEGGAPVCKRKEREREKERRVGGEGERGGREGRKG